MPGSDSYHIALADNHLLFKETLKLILGERDDLEVIGEACNIPELITLVKQLAPHLVIIDVVSLLFGGAEAVRRIKDTAPGIKVLILSMHRDEEYLYQAMAAKADGYLLKQCVDSELFSAIDKIRQGEVYFSPGSGMLSQ